MFLVTKAYQGFQQHLITFSQHPDHRTCRYTFFRKCGRPENVAQLTTVTIVAGLMHRS